MQEGKNEYNYPQELGGMKEIESYSKNSDGGANKRRRRSKHVKDGRNFVCDVCDKAYLSMPALNNHKNTKHNTQTGVVEKRARGRPRKYAPIENPSNEEDLVRFKAFFGGSSRMKPTEIQPSDDINSNLLEIVKKVFDDLYTNYTDKFFNQYKHYTENPVLNMLVNDTSTDAKEKNEKNFDDILYEYLVNCKSQTNMIYFTFLLKFALLFRECFNLLKVKDTDSDTSRDGSHLKREYSSSANAENAPDLCNDFVTEFLENNNYFGIDADDDRYEIIELIQHFCYWLFHTKYTLSRLSRIG